MKRKDSKGFTLIELLVVVAIIGLLASVVIASLSSARSKGRDARRIADVKQIQTADELAFDSLGSYASSTVTNSSLVPAFISKVPVDPRNSYPYAYTPLANNGAATVCMGYHIGAQLEISGTSYLTNDRDLNGGVNGCLSAATPTYYTIQYGDNTTASTAGTDFGGAGVSCNATNTGTETCYDISNI